MKWFLILLLLGIASATPSHWMVTSRQPLEFSTKVRVAKDHSRVLRSSPLFDKKASKEPLYIYRVHKSDLTPQSLRKEMRFQGRKFGTFSANEHNSIIIEPNIHFSLVNPVVKGTQETVLSTLSWALDRDDQPSLPLDGICHRNSSYLGQGQHIYIVDTGIYSHGTFIIPPVYDYSAYLDGNQNTDPEGHGTFCACEATSSEYGIAPLAQVHSVQVLGPDGSGYLDDVADGLNYILQYGFHPSVISMSLGASVSSQTMTNIINAIVAKGSIVLAAAGNDYHADACQTYPANVPSVIALGATNSDDGIASYSNIGRCVKGWGPGTQIISCGLSLRGATIMSGTSMVPPQYAGAAAILLQMKASGMYIPSVRDALLTHFQSTDNPLGLKMLYLNYNSITQSAPPNPPPPPIVIPKPQPPPPPPSFPLTKNAASSCMVSWLFFLVVVCVF